MKKHILVFILALCCALVACAVASNASLNIDYLVLVNKEHKLPDDWEENLQLASEPDFQEIGEVHQVEVGAMDSFHALRDDLLQDGVDIELDSCYRSVDEQIELWDYFTEQFGEEYTKKYVAIPGYSEHHTGLAIDICLVKDGKVIDDNDEMIAEREIFAKIHEKLPKYGFILRYPEGKEQITGYGYEPWHFRYVGSPEIAKKITQSGLTLEEYLAKN